MRYVAGFLIALGLIVLVFVIILKVFTGGGQPQKQAAQLATYANTGTTVQLLIDGPVVANQNHREIQINVGENQTQINIFKGYQNTLIETKTYPNNSSAYYVFLRALDFAGFTEGQKTSQVGSYQGYCAAGDDYVYQIIDGNGNRLQQYWTSTCGGGTFTGSGTSVNYLFEQQVPDYDTLTANVSL